MSILSARLTISQSSRQECMMCLPARYRRAFPASPQYSMSSWKRQGVDRSGCRFALSHRSASSALKTSNTLFTHGRIIGTFSQLSFPRDPSSNTPLSLLMISLSPPVIKKHRTRDIVLINAMQLTTSRSSRPKLMLGLVKCLIVPPLEGRLTT